VQVALALVLLVGSGLMIRTFRSLRQVDPGFYGPAELETMRTGIPETQVKDPDRVVRMEMEILRKIETLPGVSRVAAISDLPLEAGENEPVFVEDKQSTEASIRPIRRFKYVSPGYMAAIGRGLIAGRDFTWNELYNRTPVALVSENMAREIWSDPRAAIGKRIRVTMKDDWRDVIGVVADLRDDGIDQKPPTIVYWPLLLKNFQATPDTAIRGVAYIIRTPRAGSAGLHQEIQAAVASVNPTLPVADVKTLESAYELSLARTSFTLVLLAIAGGMALLLGVVGIYGVISYSVSQRSREVGIRLTLGAPVGDVVALFVRQGLVMSALGAICGLAAALPLAGLMKSLLYEIGPADPLTYLVATAVLVLAAILASYLPARRAAKVDPVAALRAE
jgi:predicted permease